MPSRGQMGQSLARVGDDEEGERDIRLGQWGPLFDHQGHGSFLERLGDKVMASVLQTLDSHEEVAGLHLAGVAGKAGDLYP